VSPVGRVPDRAGRATRDQQTCRDRDGDAQEQCEGDAAEQPVGRLVDRSHRLCPDHGQAAASHGAALEEQLFSAAVHRRGQGAGVTQLGELLVGDVGGCTSDR